MWNRMNQLFPVTDGPPPYVLMDSVELIREVKKHPVIYDLTLRRDQHSLLYAWEEIFYAILPASILHENLIRKKIRARWSWMRSTLRQDVSRNKPNLHMHLRWMQEMQFLQPLLAARVRRRTKKEMTVIMTANFNISIFELMDRTQLSTLSQFESRSSQTVSVQQTFWKNKIPLADDEFNIFSLIIAEFITTFAKGNFAWSNDSDLHFLNAILHIYQQVYPDHQRQIGNKFIDILFA